MELPFVSRALLVEAHRREDAWALRYDALLAQYTLMAQRHTPEPVAMKERTRDEVIEAIIAKSGNNGQIRSHLSAWAMKERRAGTPDEEIVHRVLVWASDDDDGSSDGVV